MNRQKIALLVLLVMLLLAGLYAYFASPQQRRIGTSDSKPVAPNVTKRLQAGDHRVVKVELLDRESGEFKGVKRDLFGNLFPRPKVNKVPPPVVKPPPPPPVVKLPTPVEVVRRDLARFTFMGYLRKQESWTIFLSANNEIYLVQEGDKFGRNDQFHALEITPEQLVIEQATQGRIVIPLVEKQPLVPSAIPSAAASPGASSAPQRPGISPAPVPRTPGGDARSLRSNPFGGARSRPPLPAVPPTLPTPATSPINEVPNEQ